MSRSLLPRLPSLFIHGVEDDSCRILSPVLSQETPSSVQFLPVWEQEDLLGTGVRVCFLYLFSFQVCSDWDLGAGSSPLSIVSHKPSLCYLSWKMISSLFKKALWLEVLPLGITVLSGFIAIFWGPLVIKVVALTTALPFPPSLLLQAPLISIYHVERHQVLGGVQTLQDRVWALWIFDWTSTELIYRFWNLSCDLYCIL